MSTSETIALAAPASRWRASPAQLARLMIGLWLFGSGEAALVAADLGNSPWTVLAQGLSVQTSLSVGEATIVVSFVVLALWVLLRQRPGLGTVLNAVVIGLAVDATLVLLPDSAPLGVRVAELCGGILLVAVGSGFYLGAVLGPGPRDGLMTGLHRVTGRPIAAVRVSLEIVAMAIGVVLGGTAGIGTLLFALSIGPLVALFLRLGGVERPHEL